MTRRRSLLRRTLRLAAVTGLIASNLTVSWPAGFFGFTGVRPAHAAITFQSAGTLAYSSAGGASVAPGYPASIAAGDLLILIIGMKPSAANGGSVTTPSGWSPITSLTGAGGYGTSLAADTGNTNIFSYSKVAAGTETGSLTVTVGTNNVSWGQILQLSNATDTWEVAGATGSDTSAGNVSIAFSSNPGVTAGDHIIGAMVIPTDVTTPSQFSSEAFTQTGITFGTVTEVSEPDSGTGNDIGGFVVRSSASSGTASAAPTMTATAGGTTTNVRGPGVFIRIREGAASGSLGVDIVDGSGASVSSPSMAMGAVSASLSSQTATGTFGTASQKIRVTNTTATATWTLSLAASATTAVWDSAGTDYDFNDPTANVGDGADADSVGGRMTIDASGATITPEAGCSSTGLTKGSSTGFAQGTVDAVTLVSAGAGAATNCYWDLTGVAISQTIPAEQPAAADYDINMVVSVVAS